MSQEKISVALVITRARYVKYESGISEAPYELLRRIALFYNVSIDLLLGVDIRKVNMDQLICLESNRILLPIAIDRHGDNVIEIIPHKARMGYLTGYGDPEFIEGLQHISLPFLRNGKFRAFPVTGDSMPPYKEGSFIIGEYIEKRSEIKEGRTYVIISQNDGIIYKRIKKVEKERLILSSDNKAYTDFAIDYSNIIEIWRFACSMSTSEPEPDNWSEQTLKEIITGLRNDIRSINLKN